MIVTITGDNSFGLRAALQKRVTEFVAEHGDLALERLDGEESSYDAIRESLQSMPFLASKKLVVLRNPGALKDFTDSAETLLASLGETTDVIIVEPKPDKRSVYYKYLKAHTQLEEYKELDAAGMAVWLVKQAKAAGGTLSTSDARYLLERAGVNQQLLGNELDKLLSYSPQVNRQTIDLLVEPTPQSTIFQLIDQIFANNTKRAMQLFDEQRQLKVEPQQIVAMIAWQLHIVALVATAAERNDATIASEAKVSPYVISKTRAITRRLSLTQIKNMVAAVMDIDARGKTGQINPDEALRNLIVSGVV